ncbi:carbohydrate ABC transporter permease [Desulfofustis glycolicus]|uniref:Multiple sugar transport system permease protein n=1 Tax=Desulfofustis glycolicus DSM 9705 TaxID=1121409 RepID=A0A1M5X2W4_9BACT|nr:sugar ABC transporter permease [Desulfofustis glycolicus]MCB2215571.1 sugar ABC transporter permease [Desulfobulbaceae bacterium]SHH93854.1 multiple sugar transport system permease protein [Desulfofustis glycolicus DSM 9705]
MKVSCLSQQKLGWLLCTPALVAMITVTAYPILYACYLSLFRYDLRFPEKRSFTGIDNYISVLTSSVWWEALFNTIVITILSVSMELLLGMIFALIMHRAIMGRRLVRSAVLIPYGIITVVAALIWKFAFLPSTGFMGSFTGINIAWFSQRWSAFAVIISTEIWKTTPFMALLLLAGLTLVPENLLRAARVDGAGAWQRFTLIIRPIMKPTIVVALLFRTLDAFRIFDTVFVQTRGAQSTESVSIVGYHALISQLNLGLGSAVSILIFICVLLIAAGYLRGFGIAGALTGQEEQ